MTHLRVEQLAFQAGEFRLTDVSFEVRPGEYFVLMGPTGSGKSLLVKSVCGLIRPTAGRIRLGSRDVTTLEPRHRRIGYVPQDCGLFPHMSVARNLTFSLRTRGDSHRRALKAIAPLIETLSLGKLLARSITNLSGGERQKVAVGRALAGEPQLLILDEPVSALDEPTRREVCDELKKIQQQLAIPTIHICHSCDEARQVSDRVGIVVGGRLVQAGPLEQILRNPADATVRRLLNVPDSDPPQP